MLSFTGSLKIYVAVEPCDLRKSFEGLAALTATMLERDIPEGALFVRGNRSRTRLKILYWDGTALWVMAKRLEEGTFSTALAPCCSDGPRLKSGARRRPAARPPPGSPRPARLGQAQAVPGPDER